jgi:hypothetical protein
MAGLLVETEEQHAHYEGSAPPHRWTDWCAAYVVARHDGPHARGGRGRRRASVEAPGAGA